MKSKRQKQDEGNIRNAAWQALTPQQQLDSLNQRCEPAKRQRAKLAALLAAKE